MSPGVFGPAAREAVALSACRADGQEGPGSLFAIGVDPFAEKLCITLAGNAEASALDMLFRSPAGNRLYVWRLVSRRIRRALHAACAHRCSHCCGIWCTPPRCLAAGGKVV